MGASGLDAGKDARCRTGCKMQHGTLDIKEDAGQDAKRFTSPMPRTQNTAQDIRHRTGRNMRHRTLDWTWELDCTMESLKTLSSSQESMQDAARDGRLDLRCSTGSQTLQRQRKLRSTLKSKLGAAHWQDARCRIRD